MTKAPKLFLGGLKTESPKHGIFRVWDFLLMRLSIAGWGRPLCLGAVCGLEEVK